MIELRWHTKQLPHACTITTLQYRTAQNLQELGLHAPIWGEWMDVKGSVSKEFFEEQIGEELRKCPQCGVVYHEG